MTSFDKVIPPGSEGKINASVDISHATGVIQKSIAVETNDPETPNTSLVIKANIKSYVTAVPDQLRFQMKKGEVQRQDVTLTTMEKQVTLSNPTVDSDSFDVSLSPLEKPAQSAPAQKQEASDLKAYRLSVKVKDQAKVGDLHGTVTVQVEGAPIKTVTVPVFAKVDGPITANPALISFQIKTYPDEVAALHTVNVRQRPDTTSPVVVKLEPGESVRVIMQNSEWYQVIKEQADPGSKDKTSKIGWVTKKLVKTSKKAAEPGPAVVNIVNSKGAFKLLDYTASIPELKIDMLPGSDDKRHTLKVSLAPGKKFDKTLPPGKITVKTDDSEQPELTIPVYVIVS